MCSLFEKKQQPQTSPSPDVDGLPFLLCTNRLCPRGRDGHKTLQGPHGLQPSLGVLSNSQRVLLTL